MSPLSSLKFYKIKCAVCGSYFEESETTTSCLKCNGPLDVEYDYDYIKSRLNYYPLKHAPISHAKYIGFFPICDFNEIVSLNEGGTPLRKSKKLAEELGIKNLYFKDETLNPTGVFKDRGSMVEVTKAKELGAKAIVFASTGNMAASVSAYANQAGIPAYIVVPEGTPLGKLAQTLAYGGRVIQVRATYSECAELAVKISEAYGFYLAGDYVFRYEGQKSQGYEIIEQLFWKAPDYIIAPIGCGTNLSAIYKGVKEFYELGFISKMPKIVGVQPEGANVVVNAFEKKEKTLTPIKKPNTICSAVAVSNPLDGHKIISAIYDTEGYAVEIPDDETLLCEKDLANKEGIFVEPSAALSLAAAKKLRAQNIIKEDETVVCVCTGNGLKDPVTMLKILPSPPSIDPEIEEVDKYLKMKLYNIKGTVEKEKTQVLFETCPKKDDITDVITSHFDITLTQKHIDSIFDSVNQFFNKGKVLTKSDLQHIIEDILKTEPDTEKYIRIEDFHVETTKNKKAFARVKMWFREKDTLIEDTAEGVGPVDAIMRAIRSIIKKEELKNYWLINYDVKIDQKGTDATVEVSMELKDEDENKVISTSTSPDIIFASIECFERAYNILLDKKRNYSTTYK